MMVLKGVMSTSNLRDYYKCYHVTTGMFFFYFYFYRTRTNSYFDKSVTAISTSISLVATNSAGLGSEPPANDDIWLHWQ